MNSKQAIGKIMSILGLKAQSFYEAKTEQGIPVKIDGDLEILEGCLGRIEGHRLFDYHFMLVEVVN
jgi:hypothetical protein